MKRIAASLPTGVRRGLPTAGVALAMMLTQAAAARAEPTPRGEPTQDFDIHAQDASAALVRLCLQADCELAFVPPPGETFRTRAVRGRMTWRAALDRMLAGTELRRRFIGVRGVRIWTERQPVRIAPPLPIETTEVAPIEVIGRLSDQIDESLRRKREADVISDGVSSERIGDLPAANLAEALQRVPGVSIEREVGEGQFVSVRGLGPLFQFVTLNGAPVAFNENIRNSTQSGRQFRFRALSVDLLAGARLIKSATPDLIDGGIGSNIDIETAGGLDGPPFMSLRLGGAAEARTRGLSPDMALVGRFVSDDGNRGLITGVSQEERSVRYDRFQIQRYLDVNVDGRTLVVPSDVRTTVEQEDRRRRSAFLGADWQATPDLRLDFDGLISTFDNAIREDRLVYALGERLAQPGAVMAEQNGVVTAAGLANGRIGNNTEISDQSHLNLIASLGAEIRLGPWRLKPRISASRARSVLDTPLERFSTQSLDGVDYVFDLGDAASSRRAARLTTDFDLHDPSRLVQPQLNIRAVESRDDDLTAFFDARRTLDRTWGGLTASALRLGGQFSDRRRDYQRRDRHAQLRSSDADIADLYRAATAGDVFEDLIDQRSVPWTVIDFDRVRTAFSVGETFSDVVFLPRELEPTGADRQNSYGVEEQVAAAYVRLDFGGDAGGLPFFGNTGLRLVGTHVHVEGGLLDSADGVAQVRPVTYDGGYQVLLPSVNLGIDLYDDAVLRMAVSRTITRPSLADLRASTVPASVLISAIYEGGQAAIDDPDMGVIFSGVGGNPALTPYVSTNLDLSYEHTRWNGSFSVAIFHKRIDDFIQPVAKLERLTFETRQGAPVQAEVLMSRPRNMGEAEVRGLEVGIHRRFGAGAGVWASATLTNSRLDSGDRLPGVSDVAWSVNPYLERGPLALNLSWSWRSAFRSEADMQGGGVADFTVGAAGYLEAQMTYDLTRQSQLSLSASNLTDTRDLAYEGTRDRLLQLGSVGRQFSVALKWVL